MKYNNFRQRTITISEANIILELLKSYNIKIIYVGLNDHEDDLKHFSGFNYSEYAVIIEKDSCIEIETKYYEPKYKATKYICNLNGEKKVYIKGLQVFNKLQQFCYKTIRASTYKNQRIDDFYDPETGRYVNSAGPVIGYNPKYEGQELYNVYEYDLHSAYSSIMLQKFPNVNKPYYNVKLKANQVGFYFDTKCSLVEGVGKFAEIAFDLIDLKPNQKAYIEKLYNKKELAIDETDYNTVKLTLNAAIGYYQRWNPFVRAYIVHKCNNFILSLLDDDSILWNTDAIFSLKRRPELELGSKIGQFEETHIKRFAYKGNNYQIDYELPKYRGIPKPWFKNGWNILTDPVPKRCNKFLYDKEKTKLIRNEDYINGKTKID